MWTQKVFHKTGGFSVKVNLHAAAAKQIIKTIPLFLLLVFSFNADAVELTLSYEDKEQPPYYMGNTEKVLENKPGVAVEMVLMLENKVDGLTVRLRRTPWTRCTQELKYNRVDGIFNASYKKERLKIGCYPTTDGMPGGPVDASRRITKISYSLYARKDSRINWNGEDPALIEETVGAPLGYSIVGDLEKAGVSVEEAPSTTMNLQKVLWKRIAAAALQDVTADSIIKSNPMMRQNIRKLEPPLATKPYYLMLSRAFVAKHPDLSERIWDAIKVIRETQFDKIIMKYIHEE